MTEHPKDRQPKSKKGEQMNPNPQPKEREPMNTNHHEKRGSHMNAHRTLVAVALALVTLSASFAAEPAKIPEAGITETPTGAYQIVRITLAKGKDSGKDLPLILGLRNGKLTNVWYLGGGPMAKMGDTHADESTLQVKNDTIQGTIAGRAASPQWNNIYFHEFTIVLDGKAVGKTLTGTFTTVFKDKKLTGNFQGTIEDEAQLVKANAFPPGKNWPWWYGAGSTICGPDCGAAMIESLYDAKPLWKSEEAMPGMFGKGHSGADHAMAFGPVGGSSSPVVAEGMVYQFYYRPTGTYPDEAKRKEEAAKLTSNPAGQRAYVDNDRPMADDVVVGLDAVTGKTVWKTIFPERSKYTQIHKWRDFNPTPFVSDGIVYVVDYANYLYALDAKNGKVLWARAGTKGSWGAGGVGPVVSEGTVLLNGAIALDAKTGKELWKGPGGNTILWRHGDRQYFIVSSWNTGVSCLDPKTGKALWTIDDKRLLASTAGMTTMLIDGDYLVGILQSEVKSGPSKPVCYRLSSTGAKQIWVVDQSTDYGDAVALSHGHLYANTGKEMVCIRLEDGKVMGRSSPISPSTTPRTMIADGRVFFSPEGRHGNSSLYMLSDDPANFRLLNDKLWSHAHPTDSSYAGGRVVIPVVDGRIFFRGHDGVYCYDLRKSAGTPGTPAIEPKSK
ncbi:MAG: PQQ-binding-like beta-propeller repeat protein [Thermoguttaceae bacterium]|jgi:outer membrane protein assembly factor BamB